MVITIMVFRRISLTKKNVKIMETTNSFFVDMIFLFIVEKTKNQNIWLT